MENENVVCDWNALNCWLNSHIVSDIWWDLTTNERYTIAEMAIKNTFYYPISNYRQGQPGCAGGVGDWNAAPCVPNSIIRYRKFGHGFENEKLGACYWRRSSSYDENCYIPDTTYNLPVHIVSVNNPYHSMCAIHIDPGIDSLCSWVIFQYGANEFDVQPGHLHMPFGCTVRIRVPLELIPSCAGYSHGDPVATFYL